MCGRYYIDNDTADEIQRITKMSGFKVRTGDIRPSEAAPVICQNKGNLVAGNMIWGYSGYQGKGLLINARAEGIMEKKTFQEDIRTHRCIIPAKGFYEWNLQKEKYRFEDGTPALFMAGCFNAQGKFIIITTAANPSVAPIHHRMPLLLQENEIAGWLCNPGLLMSFLRKTAQLLERKTDYEQLSLF